EPTSALDPRNQLEVMAAVRSVTLRENLATVLVLHDINLALRFCDRFMLVRDGRVVARGGKDVVTDEAVSETYGTRFRIIEVEGARIAVPCIA
ncbi:MAG: ABC transporter ATP-binding protein, partial [Berryella intestinalis]